MKDYYFLEVTNGKNSSACLVLVNNKDELALIIKILIEINTNRTSPESEQPYLKLYKTPIELFKLAENDKTSSDKFWCNGKCYEFIDKDIDLSKYETHWTKGMYYGKI